MVVCGLETADQKPHAFELLRPLSRSIQSGCDELQHDVDE